MSEKLSLSGFFGKQDLNNNNHGKHIVVGCDKVFHTHGHICPLPPGEVCPLFGMFEHVGKIKRTSSNIASIKTPFLELVMRHEFETVSLELITAEDITEGPLKDVSLDYILEKAQNAALSVCELCRTIKKLTATH